MPFNGIAPEKVTLLFLQLLKIKQGKDKEEDRISFIEAKENSLIADNRIEDNESRLRKIKYTPGHHHHHHHRHHHHHHHHRHHHHHHHQVYF